MHLLRLIVKVVVAPWLVFGLLALIVLGFSVLAMLFQLAAAAFR